MLVLLLILGSTPALYAQYNPTNPPEPQENIYYNITVACSPANVAYTYGAGKYLGYKPQHQLLLAQQQLQVLTLDTQR